MSEEREFDYRKCPMCWGKMVMGKDKWHCLDCDMDMCL
jgi:hypothetical protein